MTLFGKERVCIAGFCESSRDRVPYDDDRYEIWGLNRGYMFMKRAERWWDVHSPTIRGWQHRRPGNHADWLKSFKGPIYMHEVDPEIPNSVAYPLDEVQADVGINLFRLAKDGTRTDSRQKPYMDSSMAYELALAIHEGFKEIMMVGVDLNTAGEYVWQRSGVSYLMGLAQGRSIDVVLPDNCPLLQGNLYGRAYLTPGGEHMSIQQLETRLQALSEERKQKLGELHEWIGAVRESEFLNKQMVPGIDHERLAKRVAQERQQVEKTQAELRIVEGGIKETLYWIHQTPDGDPPSELANDLQVELHGHRNGHSLAEGDLDAFSALDQPEPVLVN